MLAIFLLFQFYYYALTARCLALEKAEVRWCDLGEVSDVEPSSCNPPNLLR